MNLIKRIIYQIKRRLIRFYDFHYMIRYYGEIGNGYGDFIMQIFIGHLLCLIVFYYSLPFFFKNFFIQDISSNTFLYEFIFCALIVLLFFYRIDYVYYEKGQRRALLDKIWKNKTKKHNRIMFYLEYVFWGMCIILFMLLAWLKKVLFD